MRDLSEEELEKIKQFELCCDDMINGKIILSDIKIAKILKAIAGSKELMAYFAECLLNFDFNKEFEKAKGIDFTHNYFKMPEEVYKKVALVFCILVEVDNKNIDFYDFVNKYFKVDKENDSYGEFCKQLLTPFKEEVLRNFGLIEEVEDVVNDEEIEEEMEDSSVKDDLIKHLQSMINIVQISPKIKDDKKEKIVLLLNGVIEAVKIKNKKILFGLEVALSDNLSKVKPIADMYHELLDLLIEFYSE